MTWMHVAMAVGYLVVLFAIVAFFHGASLVSEDLETRRAEQHREDVVRSTRHAA